MYISISKWICNKTKCLRPLNFFTLIGGGYLSLLWMTFSANFNALNPLLLLDTLLAPSVCATLRRKTHRFKIEHLSCPVLSGKIVRVRLVQCLAEQAVQRDLSRYMNRRPQPSELTNCRSQPSWWVPFRCWWDRGSMKKRSLLVQWEDDCFRESYPENSDSNQQNSRLWESQIPISRLQIFSIGLKKKLERVLGEGEIRKKTGENLGKGWDSGRKGAIGAVTLSQISYEKSEWACKNDFAGGWLLIFWNSKLYHGDPSLSEVWISTFLRRSGIWHD